MLQAVQFLATMCCTLFAGAAIYINVAGHPGRMACDTQTAATVWALSYPRATLMQAPLAISGCVAGVASWWLGGGVMWLFGGVLIGLVVPFTFIVIMRTNRQLLAPGRDLSSPETRKLLEKWGQQHAVRSALSMLASVVYVALLLSA